MASRFINPVPQFIDLNGVPDISYTLTFYETTTLNKKDTYTTSALNVANQNPLTLNSLGSTTTEIWLDDGPYRAILRSVSGATVWDRDPLSAATTAPLVPIYSSNYASLQAFINALTTGMTGIIDQDYSLQSLSIAGKTNVTIVMPSNTLKCSVQPAAGSGDFVIPTFIQVDACTRLRLQLALIDGNGIACDGCTLQDCTDCDTDVTVTGCITYWGYKTVGGSGNRHKTRTYSNTYGTLIGTYQNAGDPENDAFADVVSHDNTFDGIGLCMYGGSAKVHSYANGFSGVVIVGANGRSCRNVDITGYSHGNHGGFQCDVVNNTSEEDFVRNVTFNGCHAYENTGDNGQGLALTNCRNVQVLGGSFYDNGGAITPGNGIFISNSNRIRIIGAECYDTRVGAARLQQNGIRHDGHVGAEDIVIEGNLCKNNLQYGIITTLATTHTLKGYTVTNNHCLDNSVTGIRAFETDVGSILGAVVIGNTSFGNTTLDLDLQLLDVKGAEDNQYATESGASYYTLLDGSATPSIGCGRRTFRAANTGATVITGFPSGLASPAASVGPNGREIEIYATNTNTTALGVLITPGNGIITFRRLAGNWFEVSRSF